MAYPWYHVVCGRDLAQGDLFQNCPVFLPRLDSYVPGHDAIAFDEELRDVIVLTQSCDLVGGREKVSEVMLCVVWRRSDFSPPHYLSTPRGMEDVRRGIVPGFHILAASTQNGFERDICVVDFRRTYTLPLEFVRRFAETVGERLRLMPPYREHLSQAFARFFMRVGLPVDVPPFR